ncbi:hypothetical protein NL676_006547 [Syzygium grande]|nr:hypothetical protein NL676_006547 [Syzygium grande]
MGLGAHAGGTEAPSETARHVLSLSFAPKVTFTSSKDRDFPLLQLLGEGAGPRKFPESLKIPGNFAPENRIPAAVPARRISPIKE